MTLEERINAFSQLGDKLKSLSEDEFENLALNAQNGNSWFTPTSVRLALNGIIKFLDKSVLQNWVSNYQLNQESKTIGIVMAGNIPLVGFHDLLCILICGHSIKVKMSSQDSVLMTFILESLIKIEPRLEKNIIVVDRLKDIDAIIATGSDNSARYFEYYFSKYPHIIRKNRTSIGILNGEEKEDDLSSLGKDIFQYYGLGCRNVSKIYVPNGYNFNTFFESIQSYQSVGDHHKYNNNYEYNKSIYLVNGDKHLDNGFLLLRESKNIASPLAVLFYEEYNDDNTLKERLEKDQEKIQCVVSNNQWYENSFDFGEAQSPGIDDYADHVDTMKFLTSL
ncbi:acyl-CoA reductase [Fulvivirga lutea]|uniref:Acyl-CoA reductase n=1 Tax=Fulvivirga lutea TaxID=2810512 RepID=A0A975A0K1_9BACT|nr:acyl-CoA reductase [Fulvivirga lutea]QSE96896.1 acyl-CoA reductase [Fulvivirga lutea]